MTRLVSIAVLLAALILMPPFLSPGMISIVTHALIMALFAVGYGLLAGQAGMLGFGHAAYFGIGAFAAIHTLRAVEAGELSLALPLVPLLVAVLGIVVGFVFGFFATVRSGIYFAMITMALAELLHSMAPVLPEIFGGEGGLSGLRAPWLWFNFYSEIENYYLVLFWVSVCAVLLYLYTLTPLGRLTVALRDNEKRVSFLGFNARLTRNVVFAISATFAAVAGSLWAMTLEYANYTIFALETSANVVLAAFIGGVGSLFGPALGAILLTSLQSIVSDYSRLWLLYQGLIFIIVMMYAPSGLVPLLRGKLNQFVSGDRRMKTLILGQTAAVVAGLVVATLLLEHLGRGLEHGERDLLFWVVVACLVGLVVFGCVKMLRRTRNRGSVLVPARSRP